MTDFNTNPSACLEIARILEILNSNCKKNEKIILIKLLFSDSKIPNSTCTYIDALILSFKNQWVRLFFITYACQYEIYDDVQQDIWH